MKKLNSGIKSEIKCLSMVSNKTLNMVKNDCPDEYGLNNHCPSKDESVPYGEMKECVTCWEKALDEIE